MVDELLAQIDSGQVQITGEGGLIPGLIKLALERGLKAVVLTSGILHSVRRPFDPTTDGGPHDRRRACRPSREEQAADP